MKQGLLSLISSCYDIYSKSRDLFQINIKKYLEKMKGEYLSQQFARLRSYEKNDENLYSDSGKVKFPYAYAFALDPLENKIEGDFKV